MPIKEIITFGMGIVLALALTKGPLHLRQTLRELEIKIANETARTDNWGNPSIFKRKPQTINQR
jgi:hypothetical protein